jgi:hypothetical protein
MIHTVYEHVHKPKLYSHKKTKMIELNFILHDMVELFRNNLVNIMAYKLNKVKIEVQLNIQQQLKL